jgi:hypothetical protein
MLALLHFPLPSRKALNSDRSVSCIRVGPELHITYKMVLAGLAREGFDGGAP